MSGRLDLDLVGPNPELGGDSPSGRLGHLVGASATELEPRQSRDLPLLQHDGEPGAASALDLTSMLMDQFGSVLAHRDLLSDGQTNCRRGKRSSVRRGRSRTACRAGPRAGDRWFLRGLLTTGDNPRRWAPWPRPRHPAIPILS